MIRIERTRILPENTHLTRSEGPDLLEIAVPGPLRQSFHYLPCEGAENCRPGARIRVPFGTRKLIGFLLDTGSGDDVARDKLRAALAVVDPVPALPPSLLRLVRRAADYYHHGIGEVITTALPTLICQGAPLTSADRFLVPGSGDPGTLPTRARKQRELATRLAESGSLTADDTKVFSAAVVRALLEKQIARWEERPQQPFDPKASIQLAPALALTNEQAAALSAINGPGTYLLDGVTGSGKTEVYLQAISRVLETGRQALVLVPEIGLTPQTVARFTARFDVPVAVLHSGLTDNERLAAWQMAASGHAGIVIGTRSAIFTPLASPGLVVVDEEHDLSFKQQDGFRYSARDLAVMRGQMESLPVILGSATPSLESLQNAITGRYHHLKLELRAGGANRETYTLVRHQDATATDGIADTILQAMDQTLSRGEQVMVFINRRGYAPILLCRQCRWIASCHQCDARLTAHRGGQRLACHHCGYETRPPQACPDCGSPAFSLLGLGTQRLEEQLGNRFAAYPVHRIDRDSTRRKHAMADIVAEIGKGEPCILIGTQMISKGHHFPSVTLVVMLDMDTGFFSADFRAVERTGQLLLQVGGRAGRADKPGRVLVQTQLDDDARLQLLTRQGYAPFARDLLAERKSFGLPPFTYHAVFRAEAMSESAASRFLLPLAEPVPGNTVEIMGPVQALMHRRAGRYRAQLLLSSTDRRALHEVVRMKIQAAGKLKRDARWSIDIDPYDLS